MVMLLLLQMLQTRQFRRKSSKCSICSMGCLLWSGIGGRDAWQIDYRRTDGGSRQKTRCPLLGQRRRKIRNTTPSRARTRVVVDGRTPIWTNGPYQAGKRNDNPPCAMQSLLTQRNLSIQPTIEIRPGTRCLVMINKDIIRPEWKG